jgi:hypothetical protein
MGNPGRPPVDSERVNVRLPRYLLNLVDKKATELSVGRPEAIRFLLHLVAGRVDLFRYEGESDEDDLKAYRRKNPNSPI